MSFLNSVPAPSGRLRMAAPKGLLPFLAVGVAGLVADLGLLWMLEHAGLPLAGARAISLPAATLVTWALNRRLTFARSGRPAHHEALRYALVALVAQSVNYVAALAVSGVLHRAPHLAALALGAAGRAPHALDMAAAFFGAVVATLFSYTGQRYFTFGAPERG